MKKLLPLLLLIVLLGAGFLGWKHLASTGGDRDRTALAPGDLPVPEAPSSPGVASLAEPQAPPVEREEVAVPVDVSAPVAKAAAPKPDRDAIWVEGRVVFPPDTPIDELAFVVAKGRRLAGKKSEREYRALVQQDGRFKVAFGKGTKKARLKLEARYLKLESDLKFKPDSSEELLLEPVLGGRILVQFERADGATWTAADTEGLKLTLRDTDSESWTTLQARRVRLADGTEELDRFEYGGATPGSNYYMSTESPIFVSENVQETAVLVGRTEEVEISLRLGARIQGKVVDADGKGVAKARIRAMAKNEDFEGEGYSETQWVQSDENGVFDEGGLEPADTTLKVEAAGFLDAEMELGKLTLGQVADGLVVELSGGRSITGKVLWPDGSPVAGVEVRREDEDSERQWWGNDEKLTVETDSTGAFEFTGLEGDEVCRLYTRERRTQDLDFEGMSKLKRKRAIKSAPFWNAELEGVRAGTAEVILTLSSGASFVGTVVDDVGVPMDEFRVLARPADNDNYFSGAGTGESVSRTYKDAEGRFELEGLKPGNWTIVVRQRGYGPSKSISASVPGGPLSGRFELARDAIVRGRVVDPEGNPVANAKVESDLRSNRSSAVYFGSSNGESSTRTDEEGRFTLKRVSAGPTHFDAESPLEEFVSATTVEREVPPASEIDDVVLTLRSACTVVARVHASIADRPDLEININEQGGPIWRNEEVDKDGTVVFEKLNPGRYSLTLEIPAQEDEAESMLPRDARDDQRVVEFELAAGEEKEITIGEPASVTYPVSGTVLRGGAGLENAVVQLYTHEDRRNYAARTGAGGRFTAQVESTGSITLTVREAASEPGVSFVRSIEPGDEAVFTLEIPLGVVRGTVLTSRGVPAAEATVILTTVKSEGGDGDPIVIAPVETDASGTFEFRGLAAGEYSMEVKPERAGWWGGEEEDELIDGPKTVSGIVVQSESVEPVKVQVQLLEGATVTGRVTLADGSSSRGYLVFLAQEGGNIDWSVATRVRGGGKYTLRGLPEGKIEIGVRYRSGKITKQEVRVFAGQSSVLDLAVD